MRYTSSGSRCNPYTTRSCGPSSPDTVPVMSSTAAYNDQVDVFRDTEYPMMIGKTYLDHGGTTIYAKSLIDEFSAKMVANLYGNPHSGSAPAMLSGNMVDSIRLQALAFFNADPEHFDLVFTQNASASIKLVGEAFRDLGDHSTAGTFWYGYHKDAHTSLVGIRDLTKSSAHSHCFVSDDEVEDWLNDCKSAGATNDDVLPCLFAYPAQSNMTGRRLPLSWAKKFRQSGAPLHRNTYTLVDAAALATTAQLDFSDPDAAADFTALSFYKIFGFPDLGGLIIRKESGHILQWRKYFGGGTVNMLTVFGKPMREKKQLNLHENLEDGTLPFHNIIALGCGIDVHYRLYGSMKRVSQHTSYLAYRLYHGMTSFTHHNGQPLCVVYNDVPERCTYGDPATQGATVAFNLVRSTGQYIGHTLVENHADMQSIYLRSGGLCNSGGISGYLKIEPWQYMRAWSQGFRCGEPGLDNINGKPTGVVRVSLGAMSTIKDVDTFLSFLESEYVETENVLQVSRFNDSNSHWGVPTVPASSSHDSGFAGAYAQITDAPDRTVALMQAHSNAISSTRSPSPRTVRPQLSFASQRSFYNPQPTTANSQNKVSYENSAIYQRWPNSARYVIPVESLRISEIATGEKPSMSSQTYPSPNSPLVKKPSLLRFFKSRESFRNKAV